MFKQHKIRRAAQQTADRAKSFRDASRIEESAREYTQALQLFESLGDWPWASICAYSAAQGYEQSGMIDDALAAYQKAVALYNSTSNVIGAAVTHQALARLDESTAEEHLLLAADLFASNRDWANAGRATYDAGHKLYLSGAWQDAHDSFEAALDFYELAFDIEACADCHLYLSRTLRKIGSPTHIEKSLQEASMAISMYGPEAPVSQLAIAKLAGAQATVSCLSRGVDPSSVGVAIEWAVAATAHYESIAAARDSGIAHATLGQLLSHDGRYERAETHLRRAIKLHKDLGEDVEEAHSHVHLSDHFRRRSSFARAHRELESSYALYTQGDSPGDAAECAIRIGQNFYDSGQGVLARDWYERAIKGFRAMSAFERLADAHTSIASSWHADGNDAEALKQYQDALRVAQAHGTLRVKAGVLGALGNHFKFIDEPTKAEGCHLMAKEYAEQDGSPDLLATVHHNLACAQIDLQKWAEMERNFKACIDIYDRLGNVKNEALSWAWLSSGLHKAGHHDRSTKAFSEASVRYRSTDAYLELARWSSRRAWLLMTTAGTGRDLGEVTELAVSAYIYADSLRTQFPQTSGRLAFESIHSWIRDRAFQYAHESNDPSLIADLIETAVNSADHHVREDRQAGDGIPIIAEQDLSYVTSLPQTTELRTAVVATGVTRLLASANLPAGPGPLLIIKSRAPVLSRVALDRYHHSGSYPAPSRPVAVTAW